MSNILVIGASGFIGRNLTAFLAQAGHRLVLHTRSGNVQPGFEFVHCGLDDTPALREAMQRYEIDLVLHLASGLIPSSSREDFDGELESLVRPTFRLIELVAELKKTFAFFSSGGTVYAVSGDALLHEDGALEPISYYGYSKLMVESYIRMTARTQGLLYLIFRPSNPYGRYQRSDGKQGFISTVLAKLLQSRPVEVWGDGSVVRDYVLVDDLCSAVEHIIASGSVDEVINIGSGRGHSVNEVIGLIEKVVGSKIEVQYRAGRSIDRPRIVLDVERARSMGVPAPLELESGLSLVWSELKKD